MKKIFVMLVCIMMIGVFAQNVYAYVLNDYGYYDNWIDLNNLVPDNYYTPVQDGFFSFNGTDAGYTFCQDSTSENTVTVQYRSENAYGLYIATCVSSGAHRAVQYDIILNSKKLENLGDKEKQSTMCHETGHVLGLDDRTSGSAIMNVNRNRKLIYTPKTDDINGAEASYARGY